MPAIILAAETAFFSGISRCDDLSRLCISGTRTLMLEMPFTVWTDLQIDEVVSLALDLSYNVVLVHPERYCGSASNLDAIAHLAQLPVAFQVNTDTLIQRSTRKLGLQLLRSTPRSFIASDCHNMKNRPPNLRKGRQIAEKLLGREYLLGSDSYVKNISGIC